MGRVGRPKKRRKIQKMPKIIQFSPRGKAGRPEEVILTIDELETVKLADYQGLDQVNGAKALGISRASFGRIIRGARNKIAKALVDGKIIRIAGGNVEFQGSQDISEAASEPRVGSIMTSL